MIGLYEKVVYSNFKCRYNLIGHQAELRYDCSMCKFLWGIILQISWSCTSDVLEIGPICCGCDVKRKGQIKRSLITHAVHPATES